MNSNQIKTFSAIFVSLCFHGVFFFLSDNIPLSGMSSLDAETRKIFRVRDVDTVPQDIFAQRPEEPPVVFPDRSETAPFVERSFPEKAMTRHFEERDMSLEAKQEKLMREIELDTAETERKAISSQDTIDLIGREIKRTASPAGRQLTDVVLSSGPSSTADAPRIYREQTRQELLAGEPGLTGEDLLTGSDWMDILAQAGLVSASEVKERVGRYEDIADYLDVDLSSYRDPHTGGGYFRLEIKVREGVRIDPLPKEMIFLIDSSRSITEHRFERIKSGMINIIRSLEVEDTYNIIAFRHDREELAPRPVRATLDNIRNGIRFIQSLSADGRTDIENALFGIVASPPARIPSYVFLISDGMPTEGILDPEKIIKNITGKNALKRPIFSFGVGLNVSRYFLDLISYQNRAWSEFALAGGTAGRDLLEMYRKIRDPILTDLRYRVSGIDAENIFPKELPDFYNDRGLIVYGKYDQEKIFSMQMLGDAGGEIKEFLFSQDLEEARKGTSEIMTSWALSRMYHKMGMKAMGKAPEKMLEDEIMSIRERYGL